MHEVLGFGVLREEDTGRGMVEEWVSERGKEDGREEERGGGGVTECFWLVF